MNKGVPGPLFTLSYNISTSIAAKTVNRYFRFNLITREYLILIEIRILCYWLFTDR